MTISGNSIKQPFLWVIILVMIAAAWFLIGTKDELKPSVQQVQALPQTQAQKVLDTGNDELRKAKEILAGANNTLVKEATESGAAENPPAQASTPAWQLANSDAVSMPVPKGVAIYEPVSVDMDSPAYPSPGEQVNLPLPGGTSLNATVRTSNENPNGDYSWRGYLDGYGTDYPVVMTYGANSVFATITTPQGSYTLESVNGSGWVYKNPSEFELSEPGKNDYLEVPHTHNHD